MSDETSAQDPPSEDEGGKQPKSKPAKAPKEAKAKPAKDKKGGKAAHRKTAGEHAPGAEASTAAPSVASHPRAGSHVRRAKGWGGLAGFGIAAYLSMHAGVPMYVIGVRALLAGAAGYLLAWACSVTVWRHLVVAEMRLAAERGRSPERPRGGDGAGTPRP